MKPLLLTLLALVAACPIGPTVRSFPTAGSPQGVRADIRLTGRAKMQLLGELLEVRDSTLLVLRDSARVTEVPIRMIGSATFPTQGVLIDRGRLSKNDREKLRLMSRFPAGLRPEFESQLLAAYGQTEPEKVPQP
ncbi:MAG TPA: hypothetical protein VGQ48_14175 [Gemmatimonadales bacterium]|jgi:hypothetical protein|nr:hypothetical protein [Gemmatimonadales bacterium]